MKKLKKLWKNNKIVILFTVIMILILAIGFLMIYPLYSTKSGSDYGNRLEGIKEVAIKNSVNEDIKSYLKEDERIKKVSVNLKGKLYNIVLTLKDETPINEIADKVPEIFTNFSEEQLGFYDFQIFISGKNGEEEKTIIGYKNKKSESIMWSNNK